MLPIFGVTKSELVESIKKLEGERGYSNSWESIASLERFIKIAEIGMIT